ncbi:hypothetical protein IJV79_02945 [bacterium]|nr:hypothetical protein [bacterium]
MNKKKERIAALLLCAILGSQSADAAVNYIDKTVQNKVGKGYGTIYIRMAELKAQNSTFKNNSSIKYSSYPGYGGVVYLNATSSVTHKRISNIIDCLFETNGTVGYGGAISINSG